jgi:uncharacterized membrane protein
MSDVAPPSSTVRRGPSILLIVSLCLNLVFLGMFVASVAKEMQRQYLAMQATGIFGPQTLMRLAPAEQAKMQDILAAHHERIRTTKLDEKRARTAAFRAFSAPDFSADAYAQSLEAVRAADSAAQEEWVKVTLESAAALTPTERQAIVKNVKHQNQVWMRYFTFRPMKGAH